MSHFIIDNSGIGGTPFLTFENKHYEYTDHPDEAEEFQLGNHNSAGTIVENNTVGMVKCGEKVVGKVVWVSTEKSSRYPEKAALCALASKGVLRFNYTGITPKLMKGVIGGKTPGTVQAGGHDANANGSVVAVNEKKKTCDVIFAG